MYLFDVCRLMVFAFFAPFYVLTQVYWMFVCMLFYMFKYTLVALFAPFYVLKLLYLMFITRDAPTEPLDLSVVEPSCLQDSSLGKHGSVHLKERNIEIHYVANGNRSKPLMVFVHGFPEFWYSWRFQLREFGKDYYAVALDMTGYGGSSKPADVKRYDMKELATDIKEFILELGFKSCVLVGHDWGGGLSYEVAYYYPEVVNRFVVLNCPYMAMMYKGFGFKQLLRSSYVYYFQLPIIPEYFFTRKNCKLLDLLRNGCKNKATVTKEDVRAYKYTFMKGGFTPPLNYYRRLLTPASFFSGRIRTNIKVPALIVWGTDDKALGVELAEFSAKFIDQCSVKYVNDASHWVQVERPDDVNQMIREYLN